MKTIADTQKLIAETLVELGHSADSHLRQNVTAFGRSVTLEHLVEAHLSAKHYGGTVVALRGAYGQYAFIQTAAGIKACDSYGGFGTFPTLAAANAQYNRREAGHTAYEIAHNV